MSLFSGTASGEMSSGLSVNIKSLIDSVFINNTISLSTLNVIVRKGAHVFEYMVLGISYFFTAREWRLSILKILVLGLLTATIDELLQNIPIDRTASALDIFLYDFEGFILGLGLLLLILNKRSKMSDLEVLNKLQSKEISPRKAYRYIYNSENHLRFTNNAHFVKLRIIIPDEKKVTNFLRVLFFLPLPLVLFKIAIPFIKFDDKDMPITKAELIKIVNSKGIKIKVNAHTKEKVIIKTI
jgi:VanZ family protein